MLILRGAPALSRFRRDRLAQKLFVIHPDIRLLHCEYVHFAQVDGAIEPDRQQRLQQLLHDDDGAVGSSPATTGADLLLVVPRPGTISPWSSKATDIAHNCGLHEVQRLERGTAWSLALPAGLTTEAHKQVLALLHDRMTESVLGSLAEAAVLFRELPPAPMAEIDVLGGGREALVQADRALGLALA
ncbi:MAG TPA: phosphoribosylformylglycinamidine synthase, partial [Kineobactrum sp.]